MWYESWIEGIDGYASLFSFDILPDGSYSEIRLMAFNKKNEIMLKMTPDAPEFYPGIPYYHYWKDVNFESFVYRCASSTEPLYSYVNARGIWLKGFYIPVKEPKKDDTDDSYNNDNNTRTVYCLYIITFSDVVETDSMSQKSPDVANAVMNISIKLHETSDFYQAMAAAITVIKDYCGAEKCSIYTIDKNKHKCCYINETGVHNEYLENYAKEMNRTPFEVAEAWEEDLDLSDCLLLEDISLLEERDPVWYKSLHTHGINNLILFAIRYNQTLVGFVRAANFDTSKLMQIKETLELTTFLIAADIANHQLLSQLEFKSLVDGLTQLNNRNALNERLDDLSSKGTLLPSPMGIAFADLNGLKTVNDNEGHDAGDKLLVNAADILKAVFEGYEIYRSGGDEFVVFCPYITKEELSMNVEKLRELSDNTTNVSFAIGTTYCTGTYDINKAMQIADDNMYRDKEEYYRIHADKDRRKKYTSHKE